MNRILNYLLLTCLIITFLTGCGRGKTGKGRQDTIPVRVMKVKMEDLNKTLEYVGNIKGQDEAIVYPKVSGKIIEKTKEDGTLINKGEAIAYVDRDEVGLKFEKAPVESPLTGVVGRVYVDIGSRVTEQTPVAFVADMTRTEIDLDVPEKYLPQVELGQDAEITVDAYPKEKFTGKITMISPVVDLSTRAAPIEIVIDNDRRLLQSGMFAKVKLIVEKNKGIPVILKESIIGREPDTYVYIVEDNKAHLRKVTLGIRQGPYFEVEDGLKEGDLVVIMGQQKLRDGASVKAEE